MCTDCHGGDRTTFVIIDAKSNESDYSRLLSKDAINEICGGCHQSQLDTFVSSVHWADLDNETRISCTDCHNKHDIKSQSDPTSSIDRRNIPETCSKCHETEYEGFFQTFHGKNFNLGNDQVALCIDCHNSHDILPESDPNSSINSQNMPDYCSECHNNKGEIKVTEGLFHDKKDLHSPNLLLEKEGLNEKQKLYFLGPIDLAFYVPFIYEILITIFVFSLISLIILETVISKVFRRGDRGK
jgi:hypothetical protein